MSYAVKEIFLSIQGEGVQAGRVAVFLRFAGCNLWSGREADRARAECDFCDTDFVGTDGELGARYEDANLLARTAARLWPEGGPAKLVILTGGEPLLQVDGALLAALKAEGFEIALETNGTLAAPRGIDWICVSPKGGTDLEIRAGDELKLVYPQAEAPPERFGKLAFRHFLLQPKDGPDRAANLAAAAAYCLAHPEWRLSIQMHKVAGLK